MSRDDQEGMEEVTETWLRAVFTARFGYEPSELVKPRRYEKVLCGDTIGSAAGRSGDAVTVAQRASGKWIVRVHTRGFLDQCTHRSLEVAARGASEASTRRWGTPEAIVFPKRGAPPRYTLNWEPGGNIYAITGNAQTRQRYQHN